MRSRTTRTILEPQAFLDSTGVAGRVATYRKAATIYSQGDVCETVMYLQRGEVQLSVRSKEGREAIVAVLGPGDFFGEGALADQPLRAGSATANVPSTVFVIEKTEMLRVLHEQQALSDRFIAHLLARHSDIQEDLIDQRFDGPEKRMARALLLLARYGEAGRPQRVIPKISQTALADMAGITPSRVKFFMSKFRKLGFIETEHGFAINSSLLNVVLHD
jgi:CRP/FNR family cyclic AMP-dependent transcriptional regulator